MAPSNVQAAELVLPAPELGETVRFFTEKLRFRLDAIGPAENPAFAVVSGYGVRVRLERSSAERPGRLRLLCRAPARLAGGATEIRAPNGTVIELVDAEPPIRLPPLVPSFVLTSPRGGADWMDGRAGMRYRDLIPDRQGGRFIASHIRIDGGGPVADYVHFHRVRFQMIFCYRGWVRLVYEDQGAPFVLHPGDCVLQPPRIRHRVLECSPAFEAIEIGSPAEHDTLADHELALPTPLVRPGRAFSGQRFVRHQAAEATWRPWRLGGFEARDLGIAAATNGLAGAHVARPCGAPSGRRVSHDADLLFLFVLSGALTLARAQAGDERLGAGDAVVIPPGVPHALAGCSQDLELLEVTLPGSFEMVGSPAGAEHR